MKIEFIDIDKLKPATYNPRTISLDAFKGLIKSLQTFGMVDPVIVNKDLTIIGGHMRVKGWKQLGNTSVACIVLDLDKSREKQLNIVLNSQEISGKYADNLQELLEELKGDMDITDYNELRLDKLETLDLSDADDGEELEEKFQLVIDCQNETEQKDLYEEMTAKGYSCKPLTI